jgi:hypothetical protein
MPRHLWNFKSYHGRSPLYRGGDNREKEFADRDALPFNCRPFAKTTSPVGSTVFPNMLLLCGIITRGGADPLRKRERYVAEQIFGQRAIVAAVRCLQFMFYDLSLSLSLFLFIYGCVSQRTRASSRHSGIGEICKNDK